MAEPVPPSVSSHSKFVALSVWNSCNGHLECKTALLITVKRTAASKMIQSTVKYHTATSVRA